MEKGFRTSGRRRTVSRGTDPASSAPEAPEGHLILVYESDDEHQMHGPDNMCVSPRNDLVICEDGLGESQSLLGFTRSGTVFEIARNIIDGYEHGELAGATFSPDGQTLFVNVQKPGLTLAIWGPW